MIKVDFKPPPRILGQFAYVAVIGLPLVVLAVLRIAGVVTWSQWNHPAILTAAGIGAAQLLLFLAGVRFVTQALYVALTIFAIPIGFVISHVLMAAIYYLVFTPIGLVFRLIGRDAIGRRIDPNLKTYWHDRGAPRPATSYFKLY